MKVPALRRGNARLADNLIQGEQGLNESPRPKAGKFHDCLHQQLHVLGLNESPRPKAGKSSPRLRLRSGRRSLNESPRPKAGKLPGSGGFPWYRCPASMKVPALRRGNHLGSGLSMSEPRLNESPRPKAGKCGWSLRAPTSTMCLNESPRPKAGKCLLRFDELSFFQASMKVPALRRGNSHPKLTRNYAAETGALREPRGRPTQKVYPSSHLSI